MLGEFGGARSKENGWLKVVSVSLRKVVPLPRWPGGVMPIKKITQGGQRCAKGRTPNLMCSLARTWHHPLLIAGAYNNGRAQARGLTLWRQGSFKTTIFLRHGTGVVQKGKDVRQRCSIRQDSWKGLCTCGRCLSRRRNAAGDAMTS